MSTAQLTGDWIVSVYAVEGMTVLKIGQGETERERPPSRATRKARTCF